MSSVVHEQKKTRVVNNYTKTVAERERHVHLSHESWNSEASLISCASIDRVKLVVTIG